LLGEKVRA